MTTSASYVDLLGTLLRSGERDDELAERVHAAYLEELGAGTFGGVTPIGLPYPVPTDPVAAGADAIRALAQAVDPYLLAPAWRYQSDTSALAIPSGVWTRANTTTAEESGGTGTSASAGGINITVAGLYLVEALVEWAGATGGVRLFGVGSQAGSGPYTQMRQGISGSPSANAVINSAAWTLRIAAGTVLHIWTQQNTGSNLNVTTRRLGVRRVAP